MELNEVQQAVVDYDGNALVFASAGTGKTNTLALKIANIITNLKALPEEILCLTFTNKGCFEMEERVISKVGEDAKKVTIKTFHSYCYSLINEKSLFDGMGVNDYSIFDEDDSKMVIKKVVNDMNLFIPFEKKEYDMYHVISLIKKSAIEKHIFENNVLSSCFKVLDLFYNQAKYEFNEKIKKLIYKYNQNFTNSFSLPVIKEFFERYQSELELSHAYDFDDLEYYANIAIKDNNFLELLEQRFRYVFIDEAQDTSFDEYNFVKQFIKNSKVLLCGDFFQTIYEWRGSRPNEIISDYRHSFNAKTFVFNINYRSTENIANSSFELLKNMFPIEVSKTYEKDVVSKNENSGEPIYIKKCTDIYDEANFINRQVIYNNETNSCVLVRTNDYAVKLSKQVDPNRFFLVQDFQYYKRPEVKEIIAFLKLILNPYDTVSLERIALKYIHGFGEVRLGRLTSKEVYQSGIRIADLLDIKTHDGNGEQYQLLIEQLNHSNIVVFDTETTGLDIDNDEIIQIAAIKIDGKGDLIDKLNLYVKSKKSVGDSFYVHGISDDILKEKGIEKDIALNQLLNFIGNSLIVGHNVTFDISILNSELERNNMSSHNFDYYDTCLISKRFITDQPNYKLETLSKNLHLEHESSHDALDDVKATAYLLVYLINNYILPTQMKRMQFVAPYLKLFKEFATLLCDFRSKLFNISFPDFLKEVVDLLNLRKIYEKSNDAIFNIEHFLKIGKLLSNKTSNSYNTLRNIVNVASLSASDFDAIYKEQHLIPIITVHQSKGCEFNDVYIAGMGDEIFPSYVSIKNDTIDEEKRLFYVAYTRAKNRIYLLIPLKKYVRQYTFDVKPSRFIRNIPSKYIKELY